MDLFKTKYSKRELFIYSGLATILVLSFIFLGPTSEESLCRNLQHYNYHSVNGIVEKKFIDQEDHLNEIIELKSLDQSEKVKSSLSLTLDTSGLFEIVQVGYTLKNHIWSIKFEINSDTTLALDFGTIT